MKRLILALVLVSVTGIPAAWSFQPGERVTVGSINQSGTILEDTGKLVKVRLDSNTGYSEGVGVWYDKVEHKVTGGAGNTASQPNSQGNSGAPGESGSLSATKTGKSIKVGNRTGTILEETGDLVKIHFDSSGYSPDVGVWFSKAQLKETDGAVTTLTSPRNGAPPGINFGNSPSRPGPAVNLKTNPPNQASQNAPGAEKGVGAPPNGIYQCNKISGRSYIHIGTIEIKNGTYKGFSSEQGSFHPFSFDASGGIVWTGGLTGMPAGWTLKPAKYVGPDYKGHPLIRVYYTSDRGAAEVIDAVKEK